MSAAQEELFFKSLAEKSPDELIQTAFRFYCENNKLQTLLTEMQNASTEMALQFQQMRDELRGANAELKSLREQNQHLTGIRKLQSKELFGRSTEKAADIFSGASEPSADTDPLAEDADADEAGEDRREEKHGPVRAPRQQSI